MLIQPVKLIERITITRSAVERHLVISFPVTLVYSGECTSWLLVQCCVSSSDYHRLNGLKWVGLKEFEKAFMSTRGYGDPKIIGENMVHISRLYSLATDGW